MYGANTLQRYPRAGQRREDLLYPSHGKEFKKELTDGIAECRLHDCRFIGSVCVMGNRLIVAKLSFKNLHLSRRMKKDVIFFFPGLATKILLTQIL